jgi:hypothetical protein
MKMWCKKITVVLLLAFVLASSLFAAGPTAFVGLADYGIEGGRNVRLTVNAKSGQVTSYGVASQVGGVIFQAVAIPASGFEGSPVSLEYRPNQPDGQRLVVKIGNTTVTADLYDWQLTATANFANSEFTACMTLYGEPKTDNEHLIENKKTSPIGWMEFHPNFINTLTGINLFFIDAILLEGNRTPLRQITNTLSGIIPGYNDINIDEKESARSIVYIRNILLRSANNWDTYIYTDYGTDIRYEIKDGKLVFSGFPSYLFMKLDDDTETVTVNNVLNARIRQNIERVRAINPIIYRAAEQTAQWAAFFRMAKEQYPQDWERFIAQISGVTTPDIQVETPRYWIRY